MCILLRQSYRVNGKVKKKTIANLTHLKPEVLETYKLILKYKRNLSDIVFAKDVTCTSGKSIGAVLCLAEVASRLHITSALGKSKEGKLALWQVITRILGQGSRLSSIRMNKIYEIADVLGIDFPFTEDALYENLAWITDRQEKIEKRLFDKTCKYNNEKEVRTPGHDLFLYDVTSSYMEGMHNELASYGYNKDKKKGKKQVVMGLLCDSAGDPVSVRVFPGNTADVTTFHSQVKTVKKTFGVKRVTWVGDRGVIKGNQIEEIESHQDYYITGITKAQIQSLIKKETVQLGLFDENLREITQEGVRYVFRRNPQRARQMQTMRKEKYHVLERMLAKKNEYLITHKKAKEDVAKRKIEEKIKTLGCKKWVRVEILPVQAGSDTKQAASNHERPILSLVCDEDARKKESALDGCYMMKTNLPKDVSKEVVNDRYKDLIWVERAFSEEKTGLLELRPWYVVTEESTHGHAMVVTLAYKITRYLENAWKEFNLTVEEGLAKLATITTIDISVKGTLIGSRIARPDPIATQLLRAIDVTLPETIPHLGAIVVSRKKLQSERNR